MIYIVEIKELGLSFEITKDFTNISQTLFKVSNVKGSTKKIKYIDFASAPFNRFQEYPSNNSLDRQGWIGSTLKDAGDQICARIVKA